MNRNYMFYGFIAVALLGIVGAAFLYFVQAPGADRFVQYIFNMLSVLGMLGTALWGLNKVHAQQENTELHIQEVKKQTNGSLTARDQRIKELEAENAELRVNSAVYEKELEIRLGDYNDNGQ